MGAIEIIFTISVILGITTTWIPILLLSIFEQYYVLQILAKISCIPGIFPSTTFSLISALYFFLLKCLFKV